MKIDDDGAKGLGSASLTLGIIGLVLLVFGLGTNFFCSFLSLILSIIGISLGSSSLTKYKRTGATYGKGNAVAGVVINAIVLGLFLVGLLFGMLLIGLLSMAGG